MSVVAERVTGLAQLAAQEITPGLLRSLFFVCGGLVCFLFPFGVVFVVGGVLPREYSWTASVIIVLTAITVLWSEMRDGNTAQAVQQFGVLTLLLFTVEWIGVQTGQPFGSYQYTPALGFAVLGVPLAIPFAWYATVVNSWRLARRFLHGNGKPSRMGVAVMVGILTVALDLVLEPMASLVRYYWVWEWGIVPFQNYLSWFGLSVIAALWLERSRPLTPRAERGALTTAIILSLTQAVLFVMTDVVQGHLVPVALACGLVLFGGALVRSLSVARQDSGRGEP